MVSDAITKEEAAKFIKALQERDNGASAATLTANMIQTLFTQMENQDISDIELEEGEAEEMLKEPFDAEEDFGL